MDCAILEMKRIKKCGTNNTIYEEKILTRQNEVKHTKWNMKDEIYRLE